MPAENLPERGEVTRHFPTLGRAVSSQPDWNDLARLWRAHSQIPPRQSVDPLRVS